MQFDNLLIIADSDHDADMLYAVGMFVPDPFIYLRLAGKDHIVMSDLEIDRARKQVRHCRVLPLSRYQKLLRARNGKNPTLPQIVGELLRQRRIRQIAVPPSFPIGYAQQLSADGIRVKATCGGCFPEREIKAADEVKKLSAALMMAEVGMAEGIHALKACKVGKSRQLFYRGLPFTSEKLRSIIDVAIIQAGGLASHTIVAGGNQGCDPHERGYGPLRAHEPIILDIFPRSQKTGYFGDITRTVVKGRATEAVRRLYQTVQEGQELGIARVHAGAAGREVHQAVLSFFVERGYKTGKRRGYMEGFFHGTGHGLGLQIHENPRLGPTSPDTLRAGHVVTVEPGLYYRGIGAVRLEDVVLVTAKGCRNLTKFEKVLEV
jgi:Xaa-Pro aminopeptidase